MGGDVKRKYGFSRCHSVDSIKVVNERVEKHEKLGTVPLDSFKFENEKKSFTIKQFNTKDIQRPTEMYQKIFGIGFLRHL